MRITTDRANLLILGRRLAWFFGLWLAGVVTVGLAAMAIRLALHAGR